MDEQLAFADRRKKRERATIGSGAMLPSTGSAMRPAASRPQSLSHAPNCAVIAASGSAARREAADPELSEAAVDIGVEWENGDRL